MLFKEESVKSDLPTIDNRFLQKVVIFWEKGVKVSSMTEMVGRPRKVTVWDSALKDYGK